MFAKPYVGRSKIGSGAARIDYSEATKAVAVNRTIADYRDQLADYLRRQEPIKARLAGVRVLEAVAR